MSVNQNEYPRQQVMPMQQPYPPTMPVQSYPPTMPVQPYPPTMSVQPYPPTASVPPYQPGLAMPSNQPVSHMGYAEKAFVDFQKEAALIYERKQSDIKAYADKRIIDEEHMVHMMAVRTDIETKRDMQSEEVLLTEEGGLIRRQEYLLERPKDYSFANFKVIGRPVRYVTGGSNAAILYLKVSLLGQEEQEVYLDLERSDAEYYLKRFRKARLVFKRKRREKKDIIWDVVQAVVNAAKTVELPKTRGFYVTADSDLKYAGKSDLIWKEVAKYAG